MLLRSAANPEGAGEPEGREKTPRLLLVLVPLLLAPLAAGVGWLCLAPNPLPLGRYTLIGPGVRDTVAVRLNTQTTIATRGGVPYVLHVAAPRGQARVWTTSSRFRGERLRVVAGGQVWRLGPFSLVQP